MDVQEPDAVFGDLRLPVRQLSTLQSPLEYVRGGFVQVSKCLAQELAYIAVSDGRVRKELSCALCRGNGAMHFQSTFPTAQAMSRQFMPG